MPLIGPDDVGQQLPSLPYDEKSRDAFVLIMPPNKVKIGLQFPPKIVSDGKQANWQETHRYGYEEFALWKGSLARKVSIELYYVVWGVWTPERIEGEVLKIKQHLYVSGGSVRDKVPFIKIAGYRVVDASLEQPTFRLMDVSISFSKEYVGKIKDQWPLSTKITLACKLLTRSGSIDGEGRFHDEDFESGKLRETPAANWY